VSFRKFYSGGLERFHSKLKPRDLLESSGIFIYNEAKICKIVILCCRKVDDILLKVKGLVHPKMKIKSLITHPHAVPTP